MSDYRIYLLDHDGKITQALDFTGHDDLSALDEANTVRKAQAAEIWEHARLVARLDTHGDAPNALV